MTRIAAQTKENLDGLRLESSSWGEQFHNAMNVMYCYFSLDFNHLVTRIAAQTKENLDGLRLESSSWGEQFHNAMNVNGGDVENATTFDYIMHFLSFFWKVSF